MPTETQFGKNSLSGIICRCTGYAHPASGEVNPIAAVLTAASEMCDAKGVAVA